MPGTLEMDREKLANAITDKTKVIIPVDIGELCATMTAFMKSLR